MSDLYKISSRVPQGSILGPLLFLIFISDFPNASAYFSLDYMRMIQHYIHTYIHISLTASGNDLDKLLSEINNHLNDIFYWLCCNNLTLNLSKTKYVIFQPQQKVNYNLFSPLVLADQILQQSQKLYRNGQMVLMDQNISS